MNTISSLGFSVLINQPTPIFTYAGCNTVSCSTIDHLITISCSSFIKTGILIADVSDHLPIFATMSLKNAKRNALKNTYKRFFPDRKKDLFIECIKTKLSNIDFDLDPNQIMDNVLYETNKAINEIFPIRKVSRKQAELIQSPWLSPGIIKEGELRDELQKKAVRSGLVQDHENYKNKGTK